MICKVFDALITGRTLGAMMIAMARLKAIMGWQVARHMELTVRPDQGLVNNSDCARAQRDCRDEQRALHPRRTWGGETG